jgi:hypothetical protein
MRGSHQKRLETLEARVGQRGSPEQIGAQRAWAAERLRDLTSAAQQGKLHSRLWFPYPGDWAPDPESDSVLAACGAIFERERERLQRECDEPKSFAHPECRQVWEGRELEDEDTGELSVSQQDRPKEPVALNGRRRRHRWAEL